jgi:phytoene synthase
MATASEPSKTEEHSVLAHQPGVRVNLADAYASCRRVAHRQGPNFSVGFRFLPRAKRDAVYATYAFCRFVDDAVDEEPTGDVRAAMDSWQEELGRVYAGRPTRAVSVALADTVQRFPVPQSAFAGLIEGCRMDLVKNRYADFGELMEYSDLVATTISTMSLAIFGYRNDAALERGRDLATAFQLTNILRDVAEDIGRDRVYLPRDEMARFGVTVEDLRKGHPTPEFAELMTFQVERVRQHYQRAEALLDFIEPDARRCTCLMGSVYCRILDRIEESGFQIFGRRIGLSFRDKVALVSRTYLERSPSWVNMGSLKRST